MNRYLIKMVTATDSDDSHGKVPFCDLKESSFLV